MSSGTVKVSILIAAYNASAHIRRALDSCENQSFADFEVIIIDDGSTDDTLSIANEYALRDDRFVVFSQENTGQGAARNRAIEMARGTYIAILDADDELVVTFLSRMLDMADEYGSDVVMSEYLTVNTSRGRRLYHPVLPASRTGHLSLSQRRAILQRAHYTVAKLYRRTMLIEAGISYGEGYIYEDCEFLVGAVIHSSRISAMPDPLYHVHAEAGSSTRSDSRSERHYQGLVRAFRSINTKYAYEKLYDYRGSISRYMLNRVALYTVGSRRVPVRYWIDFSTDIMQIVASTSEYRVFCKSLSMRHRIAMNLFERNQKLGAFSLLAVAVCSKLVPFKKTIKTGLRLSVANKSE